MLRDKGYELILGNAASAPVLALAGLERAKVLLVAIPNGFEAGQVIEQARHIRPGLRIVARAHSDDEVEYLKRLGADTAIMGEREIAFGMLEGIGEAAFGTAASPDSAA